MCLVTIQHWECVLFSDRCHVRLYLLTFPSSSPILPHRSRLTQPDPPSRIQTLLRRGSKFRYSGRTLRQTQKAKLDRPDHNFTRYVCLPYPHSKAFPPPVFAPGLLPLFLHTGGGEGLGMRPVRPTIEHCATFWNGLVYYYICMLKCSSKVYSTMLY